MKILKLISISSLLALGACQNYWAADPNFGSSVNGAVTAQTVNPNAAAKAPSNVKGMDGPSAKASIDSYQNSFVRRPAAGGNASGAGYFTGGQSGSGSGSSGPAIGMPAQ